MDEASIWTQTAIEIAATIMTAMTTAVTMIVIGDVVVSFPLILDLVDAALVTDVVAGVAALHGVAMAAGVMAAAAGVTVAVAAGEAAADGVTIVTAAGVAAVDGIIATPHGAAAGDLLKFSTLII